MVPQEFVTLLKLSLAKLMSRGILDADIVDLEFWLKWPKKFTSVSQYENNKKKSTSSPVPQPPANKTKVNKPVLNLKIYKKKV